MALSLRDQNGHRADSADHGTQPTSLLLCSFAKFLPLRAHIAVILVNEKLNRRARKRRRRLSMKAASPTDPEPPSLATANKAVPTATLRWRPPARASVPRRHQPGGREGGRAACAQTRRQRGSSRRRLRHRAITFSAPRPAGFCYYRRTGDEHSLGQRLGMKAKELRAFMADLDPASLLSVSALHTAP